MYTSAGTGSRRGQCAVGDDSRQRLGHARLGEMEAARAHLGDDLAIAVDAGDLHTGPREHHPGRKTDVPQSDHADMHSASLRRRHREIIPRGHKTTRPPDPVAVSCPEAALGCSQRRTEKGPL